jgi:Domain of unknown function (DUF927)
MKKQSKPWPKIELSPKGVFLVSRGKKKLIAAPIRYEAVGTRTADSTRVGDISFTNFDGEKVSETFSLSDFLPRNRHLVIERLTNKAYRWPAEQRLIDAILKAVMDKLPKRRFTLVGAPGWYDGTYVTTDREYSANNCRERSIVIDHQTGAKVASLQLGAGSLKRWKKKVATVAKKSSRLRLCIATAFAAPVLRPLGMDSFGLNLYSDTSTGKSSCLVAAASVSGLIGDRGLPGWVDSIPALEQLMVGHRDGLLPLDETGGGEEKMPLAKKARLLAYAISQNRSRNLDKGYEKGSNLPTGDSRNIVLSSSERALGSIAVAQGTPRLGGEEVRLIDVPATDANSQGIFDGSLKPKKGRSPAEQGKRTVDNLRKDAVINQGFALDKFLRKYTKDPGALLVLKEYLREFERRASAPMLKNSDNRIRSDFAVMYAATALAIDYLILPWGKNSTFKAIDKCLTAALEAKHQLAHPKSNKSSIEGAAKSIKEELDRLDLVSVKKGTKPTAKDVQRRKQADGFRVGQELYVKPKSWNGITATNKADLIQHNILRTEREDTITMARKVSGVDGKPRYIVIDAVALDEARGAIKGKR